MDKREGAIRAMVESGASFVPIGPNKRPMCKAWGGKDAPVMFSADSTVKHLAASPRHGIAVQLATVGLAAVDLDGASESERQAWVDRVLVAGAPPLCVLRSQSGGHHVFYRIPQGGLSVKKAAVKWELPRLDGVEVDRGAKRGDASPLKGDLKLPGGYVGLPGDNVVGLFEALRGARPDAGLFDEEIFRLFTMPRGDNLPVRLGRLRVSEHGSHNDTLNCEAHYSVPFRRGGVIWRAFEQVALATGHAASRVASTLASAQGSRGMRFPGGGVVSPSSVAGSVAAAPEPTGSTTASARALLAPRGADLIEVESPDAAGIACAFRHLGVEVSVLEDEGNAIGVRRVGGDWAVLDTQERNELMGALRNRFVYPKFDRRSQTVSMVPLRFAVQEFVEHVTELAGSRRVNIMRDFLESCPEFSDPEEAYRVLREEFWPRLWRISGVSAEIADVAFPALLIGAVGRHYEPGAKMDAMTVLTSAPGMGKTTFIRNLLPDAPQFTSKIQEGFSYGRRNDDEDDKMNKLLGAVFVDFSEMSPGAIDLERLKGFVDRRYDTFREKYGVRAKPRPRTCVLTATSNRRDPLPHDPAGHRKFWIVWLEGMADACGEQDTADFVEGFFAEHRKRLWGAAKACWFGFARKGSVHPKLVMPRLLWGKVTDAAADSSSVPEVVREMMDHLDMVPACVDWLMPQELAELTGRVPVKDGEYVPASPRLLEAARTAVESSRGWERSNAEVWREGHVGRPRHFRRVGAPGGRRHVKDGKAGAERRGLLGIRDPGAAASHYSRSGVAGIRHVDDMEGG